MHVSQLSSVKKVGRNRSITGVLHLGQKSLRKALAYVSNKIKRKKTCMQTILNMQSFQVYHDTY